MNNNSVLKILRTHRLSEDEIEYYTQNQMN